MAVTMKNFVFWDVSPCVSCRVRRFDRMYSLHLQGKSYQWTKKTLPVASDSGTLRVPLNHKPRVMDSLPLQYNYKSVNISYQQ
jgi:hypothetical protein